MSSHSFLPSHDCDPKASSSRKIIPENRNVFPHVDPFNSFAPFGDPMPGTDLPIQALEQLWDQKDLHSIEL